MPTEDPPTTSNAPEVQNREILVNIDKSIRGLSDILKLLVERVGELNRFIQRKAAGTGNINATENEGPTDLENAADSVEQRNLAAPVLDELHKANSYFIQCLFLVGTILVGGVGAAAVPCGYKAISLPVSVLVVMLIFCFTHVWKMNLLRDADPRRAPLLENLRAPFMVDMGTAVAGAFFFLIMFGISSIMKNCGVEDQPGVPVPSPPGRLTPTT